MRKHLSKINEIVEKDDFFDGETFKKEVHPAFENFFVHGIEEINEKITEEKEKMKDIEVASIDKLEKKISELQEKIIELENNSSSFQLTSYNNFFSGDLSILNKTESDTKLAILNDEMYESAKKNHNELKKLYDSIQSNININYSLYNNSTIKNTDTIAKNNSIIFTEIDKYHELLNLINKYYSGLIPLLKNVVKLGFFFS